MNAKKIWSFLLAGMMLVSMTGCAGGGKRNNIETNKETGKN